MTPIVELVYSSAPDFADKGIANPVGEIWSGAMMLDYLGEKKQQKYCSNNSKNVGETRKQN